MKTLQTAIDSLATRAEAPVLRVMRKDGLERHAAGELYRAVRQLAGGLLRSGLSREEPVILHSEPSPGWVIAALAVTRAGGTTVPLDTQLDGDVLAGIVSDCGARRAFCDGPRAKFYRERPGDFDLDLIRLDADENDPDGWQSRRDSADEALPELDADDRAAIFYTSGTTGPPKGVPLRHRNLAFQIESLLETGFISDADRMLLPLPLHHVYPYVIGMLLPLASGASIVLPRSMTGPEILKALQQGKATILLGVPRLYDALYTSIQSQFESRGRMIERAFASMVDLLSLLRRRFGMRLGKTLLKPLHDGIGPNLEILACGGSALDPELARKLDGIGWQISVGYGLTETSPLLTLNPPGSAKLGSVGRPMPSVNIRLDPSAHPRGPSGTDTAPTDAAGVQGEILAQGPGVFDGYHNLPDKTAESFDRDGWFRTGDLGSFDEDGDLFIRGRVSEMIVTAGGENIQPEQVEDAYAQSEIIGEVGILQENGDLVAAIVPNIEALEERSEDDVEPAVRTAVEERSRQLPSYQRIADLVILRRALPRTRLGKIRRHLLAERYREAKEGAAAEPEGGPIAVEEMAAADRSILENPDARKTWDLLARRYRDRRLTPDTSPRLELGIDSMGWLDLTLAIRRQTGVELDEETVSAIGTVRDLLEAVAETAGREVQAEAELFEDPEDFLDADQKRWLEPTGPVVAAVARILFGFNRWLMQRLFHLRVEGRQNLPDEGAFVIAPNHVSYLDSFALAAALDFETFDRTFWGGWTGAAFRNFFTRFISRLARVVPVDPERGFLSSMAFGAAILNRENNLIWYPEGRRSPDGRLQPFKPGVGVLLAELAVPVVPVFITGTDKALPPGKFLQGFHPVTVAFGAALDPKALESRGRGETSPERITGALQEHMADELP